MSVAVSCNLSDGVVLAVDSAVALRTAGAIVKIYESAEKLFPLGDRPVGMAVYGLAALGQRSIGSCLREFAAEDPVVRDPSSTLEQLAEAAREFLLAAYRREVVPDVEREQRRPWAEIPVADRPHVGVVMGGFSPGARLSEVWRVIVPDHETPGSARLERARGDFGADAYAMDAPIRRYLSGADRTLVGELIRFMERRSTPLGPVEKDEVLRILDDHRYQVRHDAMPMDDGVAYARFLVELVINHHRFASRDAVVGGRVQIGSVDYRQNAFAVVDSSRRSDRCR